MNKNCQPACKPGFVWPETCASNVAAIHLGKALPPSSRNLPGHSQPERPAMVAHGAVSLFGFAPSGVYHAAHVAARAVGSYPTFSPLPRLYPEGQRRAVQSLWHFPWGRPRRPLTGTVFPWSPDFPHCPPFGRWTMRPPSQLALPLKAFMNENARASAINCASVPLPWRNIWLRSGSSVWQNVPHYT